MSRIKAVLLVCGALCAAPAFGATPDPKDLAVLPEELSNCALYLDREMDGLKRVRVVVALGRIGFEAYLNYLKRRGLLPSKNPYPFQHGASYRMPDGRILLASYHPSNQNTQTGKLTRPMFMKIFAEAARLARQGGHHGNEDNREGVDDHGAEPLSKSVRRADRREQCDQNREPQNTREPHTAHAANIAC